MPVLTRGFKRPGTCLFLPQLIHWSQEKDERGMWNLLNYCSLKQFCPGMAVRSTQPANRSMRINDWNSWVSWGFFLFFVFWNRGFYFIIFIYFIYLWLCWVFVPVRGLSLVVASGGQSSSRCVGLSLSRPLLLRSTGSRRAGSVIVAHRPSCSAACGIFPDQGSNLCPLHWQADSQPLRHQGSPHGCF